MSSAMECGHCTVTINETADRQTLCLEDSTIIWRAAGAEPEVDIAAADVLDYYCCEADALAAIDSLLASVNARPTWSDVRPIEQCAACGADFATSTRHLAIALLVESGPEEDPKTASARYPAHFCKACTPKVRAKAGVR